MSNGQQRGDQGFVRRILFRPVTTVADALVPTLVDAVDLDEALGRVDIDELLQRVDVNALVQRVDIDAVLERVDVNALLDHVDLNTLLQRVDVKELAGRVELGSIFARSTQGIFVSVLDLLRREIVGLDIVILRLFGRLNRSPGGDIRTGPPLLVAEGQSTEMAGKVSGRYAGPVSRLLAFALDVGFVFATFALGAAIITFVFSLLTGHQFKRGGADAPWWIIALVVWFFVYSWASLAIAGRGFGKVVVGLRVVSEDGAPLAQQRALLRVLTLPLSFLSLGIGFVMAGFHSERKMLHDRIVGTCVVYDWGDRPAEIPAPLTRWLVHQGAIDGKSTARTSTARTDSDGQ